MGENLSRSPRTAVIVGATGNLGQATCAALTRRGFEIDPLWLRPDRPDATLAESYRALPEKIAVAVYLAGLNIVAPIDQLTEEQWDKVIMTNLRGAFLFARAAYPRLKAAAPSLFVTISSIMVTHPYPNRVAYATAKAGLEGLTRALAVDWGPDRIATHAIRLGHLSGLMRSTPANPALLAAVKEHTPGRRLIDPAEVAEYIGWLADGGAEAVSGGVITFDPAYTINRWPLERLR